MTAQDALILALAWGNLFAWVVLSWWALRLRRRAMIIPHSLTAAAIVGVVSASLGGAILSLAVLDSVPREWMSLLVWGCWAAMLSAGVYALVATMRGARTRRGPGPR